MKMAKLKKDINVRLSEDDYNKISSCAASAGCTLSEYIRTAVIKSKTKIVNKESSIQVLYHLNKMGNNLNQQAHVLNKAFLMGIISEEIFVQNLKSLNEIKLLQRN